VYKPGNVSLQPDLLRKHQDYVREQLKSDKELPV
jgi:fructose-bisphosphate aldolase class II